MPGARGLQLRVADDPVVDLEPGPLGQHRVRLHPGADHDQVAVEAPAALGQHRADPAVALEGAHRLAADEGHAVLLEPLLEEAPGVVAEGARERHLLDRDHRAVGPGRRQRGGHLGGDVAAADQHHAAPPPWRPRGSRRRCRRRAGSGCPRSRRPRAAGCSRSPPSPAAPGRRRPPRRPGSSPSSPRRRSTSRSCRSASSTAFSSYQEGSLT